MPGAEPFPKLVNYLDPEGVGPGWFMDTLSVVLESFRATKTRRTDQRTQTNTTVGWGPPNWCS